jgi:hypothetical protein
MWSDYCEHGIRVSRIEVPKGAEFIPVTASPQELARHIPAFIEIGPSGPVVTRDDLSDLQTKILRLLHRNGPMTRTQIAAELSLSQTRVDEIALELAARREVARTPSGDLIATA